MVTTTVATSTTVVKYAKKVIVLDEDSKLTVTVQDYYPLWFYIVLTTGIVFCTVSCGIWFICAMMRLKHEKRCKHPEYTATIVVDHTGEQTLKPEVAKHSKKAEVLSEAESLAKSFKSLKSKRSSKRSSKSMKTSKKDPSTKKSSAEKGSKEKVEEKVEERVEEKPEEKAEEKPAEVRADEGRADGGLDGIGLNGAVAIQIEQEVVRKDTSYFRAITGGLFFSETN